MMRNNITPPPEMKHDQALLNKATYEPSVVQVETVFNMPDYTNPWQGVETGSCSGTGIVIEQDGKKYVLTNAHCVENAALIRVRLSTDRDKEFEARSVCISYQCDLALLEVMSRKFSNRVKSARIGDMVSQQEDVYTVGYPIGGDEICITKGIVSRIESDTYSMSGLEMLQVQVDSAINSGNSGGPVFGADGRVVGVAFQGLNRAQSVGYMIPVPIVNHFLQEVFNGRHYRGFPVLPISIEQMKNTTLRQYYGMGKKDRGVRIRQVDTLSDAYNKLQPNDILLAIDGLPVSNAGKVDVPGIGKNILLSHVTHMKFIGDSVNLRILRKNSEDRPEMHEISVVLDHIPYDFRRVPAEEHDKMPSYFIASGIALIPLTRNYLDDGGADLEEVYYADKGCRLKDMQKEHPEDQIIVINDVFECRETKGYKNIHCNTIVREINGRKISNMQDAIEAIEGCLEPVHCFVTSKGRMIVKNMSLAEHAALLATYKIHFDRSEDLRPLPPPLPLNREESESSDSDSALPARAPVRQRVSPLQRTSPSRDIYPTKKRIMLSDDSEDSDNNEQSEKSEKNASKRRSPPPVRGQAQHGTPGLNRYNNRIDSMFQFYSQFPLDDDSAEDLDYAEENSQSTGSESSSPAGSEAEESDSNTSVPPKSHKRKHSPAFFRDSDNSDTENGSTRQHKRHRGSAA